MTPDERRARLREILDEHSHIAQALRQAETRADEVLAHAEQAMAHITALGRDVRASTAANRAAIDAMIAANEAALALFNDDA